MLAALRPDVTYPGDPGAVIHARERRACTVSTPHEKDTVWLPEATRQGWLIITRDRHIERRPAEIAAVFDHGAQALSGPEARGTFEQLEVVMCQWRAIEALYLQPGPYIYRATRTTLEPVALEGTPL